MTVGAPHMRKGIACLRTSRVSQERADFSLYQKFSPSLQTRGLSLVLGSWLRGLDSPRALLHRAE